MVSKVSLCKVQRLITQQLQLHRQQRLNYLCSPAHMTTIRCHLMISLLDADENDTTIKYHTKAPDQPKSLEKIKYRDELQHLEALLDYEHKYRIKYELSVSPAWIKFKADSISA